MRPASTSSPDAPSVDPGEPERIRSSDRRQHRANTAFNFVLNQDYQRLSRSCRTERPPTQKTGRIPQRLERLAGSSRFQTKAPLIESFLRSRSSRFQNAGISKLKHLAESFSKCPHKKLPRAKVREDGKLEVEGDKYPFIQGMIRSLVIEVRDVTYHRNYEVYDGKTTAGGRMSGTAHLQKGDALDVAGMQDVKTTHIPFSVRASPMICLWVSCRGADRRAAQSFVNARLAWLLRTSAIAASRVLSENFTSAPMRAFTTNAGLSMHCSNVSSARSLSSVRRMSEGVRVLKLQNEESLSFDR
jgi:hypothetical protein